MIMSSIYIDKRLWRQLLRCQKPTRVRAQQNQLAWAKTANRGYKRKRKRRSRVAAALTARARMKTLSRRSGKSGSTR